MLSLIFDICHFFHYMINYETSGNSVDVIQIFLVLGFVVEIKEIEKYHFYLEVYSYRRRICVIVKIPGAQPIDRKPGVGYRKEKGMGTRKKLAEIARKNAALPFHGFVNGKESNIEPIIRLFPKWNIKDADGAWCAAFVYYCCVEAGFEIPYSPDECRTCSLAGCGGWEEYAIGDSRIEYHRHDETFVPEAGDIVLYDKVFMNQEHDHIGILLEMKEDGIIAAEGNMLNNTSGIRERPIDEHIRAYIRIPDAYTYKD